MRFNFIVTLFACLVLSACTAPKPSENNQYGVMHTQAVLSAQTNLTSTSHVSDGTGDMFNGVRRFAGSMGAKAVSYKGYQYAVFYEGKNRAMPTAAQFAYVVIARRKIEQTSWEFARLDNYKLSSEDAHNRVTIGISGQDGVIHISFDHHNSDQLNYAHSVRGLANSPEKFEWEDALFTFTPNLGLENVDIGIVTYPYIQAMPDGNLFLYYRDGLSYGGDMRLAYYDANVSAWQWVRELSSRHGSYLGVEDERGPYLSGGIKVSADNTLMMSWLWRETNLGCAEIRERVDEKMCNQGMYFATSKDFGVTWQAANGETVANLAQNRPISIDTVGPPLIPVPHQARPSNVLNHGVIDPKDNRYHLFVSHLVEPFNDLKQREVFHYIVNNDGSWQGEATPFSAGNVELKFVGDTLYAFAGRNTAAIYAAQRSTDFKEWRHIKLMQDMQEIALTGGHITWDLSLLADGKVSALWHHPSDDLNLGKPSPLEIYDFILQE